jgi:LPS sulfotransferase NodH
MTSSDDDSGFADTLIAEARASLAQGRAQPAKLLLDRALLALDDEPPAAHTETRRTLAQMFLDVDQPERAVYALTENVDAPALRRRAVYAAAAAFRAGAAPVDVSSHFVRRLMRLPAFAPDEIRQTHREMAALLDPFDAPPRTPMQRPPIDPQNIYTICMMPRAGTNFLVQCLSDTGVLGRPGEYLHRNEPTALPSIVTRFGPRTLDDVMAEIMGRTRSPNGMFGIKVHIGMLLPLLVEGTFDSTLARGKFIYITRDDLLMQAISFVRAQMTGVWIAKNETAGAAHFDFARLHDTVGYLTRMMTQWETFFALNGITPLRIRYEAIDRDVDAVVARVAQHLGVALPAPTQFRERRQTLQRDAVNEEWRARFIAQAAPMPAAG